jgi:hypothetical protein
MLSDLNKYSGSGDKLPGFTFARVGDGVKGTVARSALVETKTDRGPVTKLVLELDVIQAKGGRVDKDGDFITAVHDIPAGERVAVWLPPGFGIGAVRDALEAAGASSIDDGATMTVKLEERRDTGKPKPANVYSVVYEAPKPSGVSASDL